MVSYKPCKKKRLFHRGVVCMGVCARVTEFAQVDYNNMLVLIDWLKKQKTRIQCNKLIKHVFFTLFFKLN